MSSPFRPSGIYSAQWLPTDSGGALDRAALATHLALGARVNFRIFRRTNAKSRSLPSPNAPRRSR
jgi:hypothetical protein